MANGQPRIDYGRVFNVAPNGASLADFLKIATAAYNTNKQTVGFSYDDAGIGDLSNRRAVLWDIPVADRPGFVAFFAQFYPGVVVEFKTTGTNPVDPPPPPPVATGKTRLGVNVITGDGGAVNRAISAGCNAVSIINNFLLASQTAMNPAITVMARRYVSSMPSPDLGLYEGAESPNVIYLTALNEQDVSAYGTVEQIRDRAGWDREMWRKMKALGRHYAGGGFSVGTPEFNDPAICQALKDYYAPLYADGMAMNHHLYSPWPNHAMDVWYETRWRFFFERCGFDPNPNLAGIYCDETGMDQGSVGGFPQVGYTPEQVGAWSRTFLDVSQSNGYGNLLRAAAVFQSGNTTDWRGYNVDRPDYLAAIGAAAQAPVNIITTRERLAERGVPPVIAPTPRKVMAQYEADE